MPEDIVTIQGSADSQNEDDALAALSSDAVAAAPAGGRAVAAESSAPALEGSAHVQRMGWVRGAASADGTLTLGTTGMALRLEAIRLAVAGAPAGSVSVRAHVQTYGWRPYAPDGAGTTGESKRLEAVRIRLEGELARDWSVQYRVHSQTLGWLGWAADGQAAGTGGMSKRLESVQVRLVPAGAPLPAGGDAYVDAGLSAEAHVQGVGWQGARRGMDVTVGTSGQSRRMEALRLSRPSFDLSGDVECQAHVQGVGWQGWVGSGRVAGTTGEGRRVEAVRVRLTGELDSHYDVWYRLHVQGAGWLDWACNGQTAGTEGLSLRVESIQIVLLPEGSEAPGETHAPTVPYVSGNASLDIALRSILRDEIGEGEDALRKAYDYVKAYAFEGYEPTPSPSSDWRSWSKNAALEMYRNGSGNCYRYASLFAWIARALGYDAYPVIGKTVSTANMYTIHSWAEVVDGSRVLLCDPDLQKFIPDRNFFMDTYEDSPAYFYTMDGQLYTSYR